MALELFIIINLLILASNLFVLALVIKLYTEYFKDKKMTDRTSRKGERNGS